MADEVIWVQCDSCSKWRKMPHITNADTLPLNWFCWLNPDKRYASCSAAEEAYTRPIPCQ